MEQKNIIIGFEFGQLMSQVCYYDTALKDAVSAEVQLGSKKHSFQTVLSKAIGKNEWHSGIEAAYFSQHENDVMIDNIYDLCMNGTKAEVEGQEYEAGILLALFLKQTLATIGISSPDTQIAGMMVTVPSLSRAFVDTIRFAYEKLGIAKNRGFLQDYNESFYYYTLYQKTELWSRDVGLFVFEENHVTFSLLTVDQRTKPQTVYVTKGKPVKLSENEKRRDDEFYKMIEESIAGRIFSTMYLLGEGFDKAWAKRSTPLLCRQKRHVFHGNNLYVKGACFSALEKVDERRLRDYLYIGNALVRNNIGMNFQIQGSPSYQVLLSAGVNWYDSICDFEIILDNETELDFMVSSMESGKKEKYKVALDGLPDRPNKTTRLYIHMEYDSATRCKIEVEDLGFGEMYPSSGKIWQDTMEG